jgi:hypothetical protein
MHTVATRADIEVIAPGAFSPSSEIATIVFESGTRLKEIGEGAFAGCKALISCHVPSSVEIIGDRCFEKCAGMETITFEDSSTLRKIGERAFADSIGSITIPASTEEIDGSAFVGCRILTIGIAPESRKFTMEGNLLLASEGTEIVRYFGRELEVTVPLKVEILRKSCFEACSHIQEIHFGNGSQLRGISWYALSNCDSLKSISIPASVEVIEEAALKGCSALESCTIAENATLVRIENEAFSDCQLLRSFDVPQTVSVMAENCFHNCNSLYRLRFATSESLRKFIGDSTMDEVLERVGFECHENQIGPWRSGF